MPKSTPKVSPEAPAVPDSKLPNLQLWRTEKRRLDSLQIPADAPRKKAGDLEELKASILAHGLLLPLLIEPCGILRGGMRRLTALLDLFGPEHEVDCILMPVGTNPVSAQLAENLHRRELSPLEEARAYRAMLEEFKWSQRRLATELGLSPSRISMRLNLLAAPDDIQQKLEEGELPCTAVQKAYSQKGLKDGRASWVRERVRRGQKVDAQFQKPNYRIPASKLPDDIRIRIFGDKIELKLEIPNKLRNLASPVIFTKTAQRIIGKQSKTVLPLIRDGVEKLKIREGESL